MDDEYTIPTPDAEGAAPDAPPSLGDRFEARQRIRHTGSAALWKAWDLHFDKPVAVKIYRDGDGLRPADEATPIEERFRHPCLVRLLAQGITDDGRRWVAMDWVEGDTLLSLVHALHDDRGPDITTRPIRPDTGTPDPEPDAPVQLRQVLHLLAEAAEGLGAAHAQGLVHLDLKPDNIMFEPRAIEPGRVRPVEWRAWLDEDGHDALAERVLGPRLIDWELSRSVDAVPDGEGDVPGFPAYMAPEYIRRQPVTPAADVYALGAILYFILAGTPPYRGSRTAVRAAVAEGRPPMPLRVPAGLEPFADVCRKAMAAEPERRYRDGAAFAMALRRAQAQCMLALADTLRARTAELRAEATALRKDADATLQTHRFGPTDLKAQAWEKQDQADELDDEADHREAEWLQQVNGLLTIDPGLAQGRERLIGWLTRQHARAEQMSDARSARLTRGELAIEMRRYDDLPAETRGVEPPVVRAARALLADQGQLSLDTHPDARITVRRVRMQHRRLVAGPVVHRSTGAIELQPFDAGRLVIHIDAPDHAPVVLPVRLHGGQTWQLVPPGETEAMQLALPPRDAIGADEVFIAPGWARLGGQPAAPDAPEGRWVWIDGFVIQRNPVTHRAWLDHVNALCAREGVDEARAQLPGSRSGPGASMPQYRLTDGRFTLGDGPDDVRLDWPVTAITWFQSDRYIRWLNREAGLAWRMPSEWEWEKVSRCGDSRRLPWGDHMDPTWTRIGGSTKGTYSLASVHAKTFDETVHGVRWTVGQVTSWCADPWRFEGPPANERLVFPSASTPAPDEERMTRGAAFFHPPALVSSSSRFIARAGHDSPGRGLRLVRSWPGGSR